MTNDYDIVIIGGTIAGYQAALEATQVQAKVALVQPQVSFNFYHPYVFRELGNISSQCLSLAHLGFVEKRKNLEADIYLSKQISNTAVPEKRESVKIHSPSSIPSYQSAMLYAENVTTNINQVDSLTNLAAQGVDVIIGSGKFQTSSSLSFAVNDRIVKGRTYLLACGSVPEIPDIEGLTTTNYFTLANIWQCLKQTKPPKNWVIIGGLPQSVEIAQILARLGGNINLILNYPSVLSYLEPEIAQLLIAQLEADGVKVFNKTIVSQVRQIEDTKWIQAGDKAIDTDEILIATRQQPNIENLNLAAAGVKLYPRRLVVNKKLQTTNPRIYACGDIIGGYDIPNIGNCEAKIAVQNALFLPKSEVNYNFVPWMISSQPEVAQIGLTELQAKRQYGKNQVLVFKNYFKSIISAHIENETTGICKLIVLENGKILGCSILGAEAGEIINLIALAISQNLKIASLENLAVIYPSYSEILTKTAREWSQHRLTQNLILQEFLQSFLHFRRDWNF